MTDPKPSEDNTGRMQAARDTMEQSYRNARAKASSAYAGAVEGAEHAVDATKRGARTAARKTASTVDTAPLAVLVGGLAIGALAGGLLPRTQRETAALGPVGRKVTGTAAAAARAAKTAGQDQLKAAGISRDTAKCSCRQSSRACSRRLTEAGNAATSEVKRAPRA